MVQPGSHPLAPQSHCTEKGTEAQKEAGSTSSLPPRSRRKSELSPECRPAPAWPHRSPLFMRHGEGLVSPGSAGRRGHGALAWEVENNKPAEDEDTCQGGEGLSEPGAGPGLAATQRRNRSTVKVQEWRDFPGGTVVKNPPANSGDVGSSPGLGRSHMPRSN